MSYSFLFPAARKVLEILGSPLIRRLSLAWGMKDDLVKIEITLSSVRAALLDADEMHHEEGNHHLKDWLGKLKTALSEADYLLDEFQIYSLRRQRNTGKVSSFFKPGSNQLIFRFKMSNKIKKLRERFEEIASDRKKFNLVERLVDRDVVMRREMTHSFVNESDVIGRWREKATIIGRLKQTTSSEKLPVIPIIGIGGLGKTTFVQMVYNDKRVIEYFDLRIWVCISDEFVLRAIISNILKSITRSDHNNLEIDQLQLLLRQHIEDKKILLVLDDVWNEERDKWTELMALLASSGAGSKVVVTARSELVAAVVAPATSMHMLKTLSNKDCLSLLIKWAFWKVEDASKHPNLVEIGREIVKKCKGVPLAVRTLGKLLYMKTEEGQWTYVRDNDVWESGQGKGDIMPALKLSYHQLPSHLKQCFAYCALFPKDFPFLENDLVHVWRAQGLIRLEQNKTIEESGKEYLALLISRGFFQRVRCYGFKSIFTMHDLVHDLAFSVAKHDLVAKHDFISSVSGPVLHSNIKVQHLSLTVDDLTHDQMNYWKHWIPNELLELKHQISSFLLFGTQPRRLSTTFNSFIEASISRFKLLRVLHLCHSTAKELPRSIGCLQHLRYLDLTCNFYIKSLPHSMCELVCLETLKLTGCLALQKLPVGLGKLIRLKCFHVTTREKCLPEKEITCLTALQVLQIDACENMEFLLSNEGMKRLSSLRTLEIIECRSLVSLPTIGLRELHNLDTLTISYCLKLDLQMDDLPSSKVGEHRGGLRSMRALSVSNMHNLKTLPTWLFHGANALKELSISGCISLTTLMPGLGYVKGLQRLYIHYSPVLKSLPDGINHYSALSVIILFHCPLLVSRCKRKTGQDWGKISHVPDIYLDGVKI